MKILTRMFISLTMIYLYTGRVFAAVPASSLVPCDGSAEQPCHFKDFILLANNITSFILYLILPIAAIIFMYVGILFLTSGGSTEVKGTAKKILGKAITGLILVLAAWLIVKTILITLLSDGSIAWF